MMNISGINETTKYESGFNTSDNARIDTGNNATDDSADAYDSEGAMQFIICTVVVYATFGVFCTLVGSVKKKATHDQGGNQDEAITLYLKGEKKLKFEGYKQRLQYVCDMYSEQIRRYEEKVDLLDIQQRLQETELGLGLGARSKSKKDRRKKRSRPSVDLSLGRMGLSLLYTVDSDRGGSETDEEKGSELRVHGRSRIARTAVNVREGGVTGTGRRGLLHPQDGELESNVEETDIDV